jgi:hypothetical protein
LGKTGSDYWKNWKSEETKTQNGLSPQHANQIIKSVAEETLSAQSNKQLTPSLGTD